MKQSNKVFFTFQSLPHNFLAEKMILQCIILDNTVIDSTRQQLSKQAFYFHNHQNIFKILCLMCENNLIIDISTLTNFIQSNGLTSNIGGLQIIAELNQNMPNLAYLEEYIQIVNDKFFRRSLIKFSYNLISAASSTNESIQQISEKAENDLFNIINHSEKDNLISGVQLLNIVFKDVKKKFFHPEFIGLRSGFTDLDRLTHGFQNSDLIILAGRPSMGKTALSLNITLNILKSSRLSVIFFTLEMPQDQIMYRLLALESNITSQRLKSGELCENDWLKLTKVFKILSKFPLFINDKPNLTIQDIRDSIKKICFEQTKVGLVVVDYLQLIQSENQIEGNRAQQLSQITKSLKIIAREFDIPIVALSQLSRNIETRVDQKPILSDLRESGSIEQDADLVLMISSNKDLASNNLNLRVTEIIIAKQRNGPLGTIRLNFNEQRMKFMTVNNSI